MPPLLHISVSLPPLLHTPISFLLSTASQVIQAGAITTASRARDPQISVQISGLIKVIQKHGPVHTVQAHLQGLTKAEKALHIVDMLNLHQQQGEVLAVIVSHLWDTYVVPEKLWEHYEGGESRFKEDISYDEFIVPTLTSAKASKGWTERHISRLESKWGAGWEKTINVHSEHPSVLSEHYLRNMAMLACNCMRLSDARLVLHHVVEIRISHPGKGIRTQRIVMVSDIRKVVSATSAVSCSHNIQLKECTTAQLVIFIGTTDRVTPHVTQLDTLRITQNASPPANLPQGVAELVLVELCLQIPGLECIVC
ncbi:hypothetical protein L873DRAFT_1908267 [Choiromyces venosus 120613-1]|uniref:Uncharacterized protein n=1 Tax=Choiromyces venosus 120613-1 TaxID=1336337 RepID=A0A3N4IS34_9PEZI|nr:hypothetical protein L873DRAFT_1908267 [Choiromyces venosus 120613-1]